MAIIYIYDSTVTDFTYNGQPLNKAYEVVVDNMINDSFFVTFNHPLDDKGIYKIIEKDKIVKVHTPDGMQPFRIMDRVKYMDHISIEAWPLFYADMRNKLVRPLTIRGVSGQTAINAFVNNLLIETPFTFTSNITDAHDYNTQDTEERENNPNQLYNALDVFKDIVKRWQGELVINGYDVRIVNRLGKNTGALLYEKKNISDFTDEESIQDITTRLYGKAEWTERPEGSDEEVKHEISVKVESPLINAYSGIVFEKQYTNNDIRTEKEMRDWLNLKFTTDNIDKPSRNIKVGTNIVDDTVINMGDSLVLKYVKHDVDMEIRMVGYTYDGYADRYITVQLGDARQSYVGNVQNTVRELETNVNTNVKQTVNQILNANGERMIYSVTEPVGNFKNGDVWFDQQGGMYFWDEEKGMWIDHPYNRNMNVVAGKVDDAAKKADEAVQAAKDADTKANSALEKAGANANLLTTHQNTIDTIHTVTLPDIASSAGTALANAKDAMDEAKKADDKIADFVKTNGLVDGTTVESMVNDATGEISKKITTVEGKIPTEIGARNYVINSNFASEFSNWHVNNSSYVSLNDKVVKASGFADAGIFATINNTSETETYTISAYVKGTGSIRIGFESNIKIIPIPSKDNFTRINFTTVRGASSTFVLYTNTVDTNLEFKNIQIEKGSILTDWKLAPEDNYTQEEFKIFESTYSEDVKGIMSSLSALSNSKLDGSTYTTFYKNEYEKTAEGLRDAYTKIDKVIDEDGNTTDTFAKAVYDQNATRRTEDFTEVTKDLVKEATYTAGINGLSSSIGTISGRLDKLTVGGRNYALKSNAYYYTTDYKVSEYDLAKIPKGTKIKISVWGGLGTSARTFGAYINNGNGTTSGNSQIIELTKLDGVFGQGVSTSLAKWTGEATLNVDATKVLIFGLDNNSTAAKRVEYIKVETGGAFTDWTIAPEDMLGKADFQVFKTSYEANDKLIKARLLAVDSGKEGSIAYRLNETEKTASGNTTTISDIKTKPGEQITGYQTIKERSELYERVIGKDEAGIKSNMARMVMTDSLFKTEVIKNVPLAIGGRNYVLKSNDYYYTSDYKVAEYDLSTIPKGTKIKISLWGGLGSAVRTFGVYINNSIGTTSGNSQIIELTQLDGVFGQGVSVPLAKWTGEATLNVDASKILVFGLDNNSTSPKRVEYVKVETGDYYTDWTAAPEDKANMAAITLLEDSLSLKVSRENLLSDINLQANGVLIQSGTNKLNVTPETTYIEDSTIKSAMIESLEADKIKTGTLDASKAKIINLDAESITSNQAKLIQAGFTSSSGGTLSLNGDQLLSTASDGSQVYLQNGIMGTRNPSGATIGQIGYIFSGSSPVYTMRTSLGSHFALNQTFNDTYNGVTTSKEKETIKIMAGGTQYINSADRMDLYSNVYFQQQVNINNANDLIMSGGKIINPYGIQFQNGGELYSLSEGQATRLNGVRELQIQVNGTRKMQLDSTRNYMYQPLNMRGNGILEQSDERIKTNIRDISQDSLSIVKNTRFADYEMVKDGRSTFGFIAQQLQTVAPHLIFEEDGRLTYDTIEWTQTIAHGLQQLDNKVDDEVAQLKAQVASLQEELAQLKGA